MGRDEKLNAFNRWRTTEAVQKTVVYDRFQRPLQEGDVVYLIGKQDIMWRVQSVKAVLNPLAPPGMIELTLVAVFVSGLPGGTPIMDLIKVKDAGEMSAGAQPQGDGDNRTRDETDPPPFSSKARVVES